MKHALPDPPGSTAEAGLLPLSDDDADDSSDDALDVLRTLDSARRSDVLVVDDERRNITAIEEVLASLGARTTSAASGEQALRCLLDRDFAVILLDVNMPTLDGFATARMIRSRPRNRRTPIIFMTAYSPEDADVRRAYGVGAVDYLFKPIVPEILRAKVKVFVDLRDLTIEVAQQAERLREAQRRESLRQIENERRKWEAEVLRAQVRREREAKELLADLDRRKDAFIAQLAHELRNPLVPLVLGVQTLRECDGTAETAERTHERMERQIGHLVRLVEDLTDVARISHGKLQLTRHPLELGALIEDAIEMRRPDLGGRTLRLEPAEREIVVDADPVRLTQVISNLVSNAIRYTGPDGTVVVRWGVQGQYAHVAVADDGRGIAPDFLPRVFDSFAQEHGNGRGLGLGLTVVRQLVELHGGTVEAHSEGVGHGSEFVVRLPALAAGERPAELSVRSPETSTPPRCLRICIVEDDDDIRDGVCTLLRLWGHEVVGEADNGRDGVELLTRMRPDVALVDIGLPGLDGHAVAERVRERCGDECPRLVAMTGFAKADCVASGVFDLVLTKPPDPEALSLALAGEAGPCHPARSAPAVE